MSNLQRDLVSVCICTYKRPEMLERAMKGIISQGTGDRFAIEVVVVDNDSKRSAKSTIKQMQFETNIPISYDCEPEQNIALARNRAVKNARGNLIAWMDDDEAPVTNWLFSLYIALKAFKTDGVLGPVLPFYPSGAPEWIRKANIFDRRRFRTGTRLTVSDTRTGNVLLERSRIEGSALWFDPAFGRTGGEDVDFFQKQIAKDRVFVWCDEAVIYETIPPERWQTRYHFRKYVRIGTLNGERIRRSGGAGLREFSKTIAAIPAWLILLLVFLPFGKHLWIRPALKLSYFASCLLACCSYSLIRQRD